jgi:two-component system phosphate regulon sensor histidine kinase PhoR
MTGSRPSKGSDTSSKGEVQNPSLGWRLHRKSLAALALRLGVLAFLTTFLAGWLLEQHATGPWLGLSAGVGIFVAGAGMAWMRREILQPLEAAGLGPGGMLHNWGDWIGRARKSWNQSQSSEVSRLQEAAKYRKDFIGNLAHELRTPAQIVQTTIYTLHDGGLQDPQKRQQFLQTAVRNIDRMVGLLEDLDTITRIESGVLELEMRRMDLVPLVEDTMEALESKARKAKITLRLDAGGQSHVAVLGDQMRLGQVLTNLINNSIKYGRPEGTTTVRISPVEQGIRVEVQDTGIGIPESALPRLFERFFRVDASRSRAAGGSGLGLAIVKHIIEAHGSEVEVRSTLGEGSRFSFVLKQA